MTRLSYKYESEPLMLKLKALPWRLSTITIINNSKNTSITFVCTVARSSNCENGKVTISLATHNFILVSLINQLKSVGDGLLL